MALKDKNKEIFDYFISYKQKDTKTFTKHLSKILTEKGAVVWLDQTEMRPGDSILSGIQL